MEFKYIKTLKSTDISTYLLSKFFFLHLKGKKQEGNKGKKLSIMKSVTTCGVKKHSNIFQKRRQNF